jgi:hypothetical protein
MAEVSGGAVSGLGDEGDGASGDEVARAASDSS